MRTGNFMNRSEMKIFKSKLSAILAIFSNITSANDSVSSERVNRGIQSNPYLRQAHYILMKLRLSIIRLRKRSPFPEKDFKNDKSKTFSRKILTH